MSTVNVLDASSNTVPINAPNANGQATMANSRPVVVASDQSTIPVNQPALSITDTVNALNDAAVLNLNGAGGFAVDVRGSFTATLTFQGTIDGVNWFTLNVMLAQSGASSANVSTTTVPGQWIGLCAGLQAVRVIATAYTSGTATVVLRATNSAGLVLSYPTGQTSQPVTGPAAHDAVVSGNPVRVAARAMTANYAAVASGDVADIVATLVGAQIMKPFSIPEADWQDARSLTTTTAAQARAAQAAGIRNYVTGAQFSNSGGTAVDVLILDGATEIWRATVAPNGFVAATFQTPLRGSAATVLNVNLSAAGTVRSNVQGFSAP